MNQPTPLLRSLSLLEISFYGIGTIVGAGIYVLLGAVVSESGMMAPWAFLLAAVVVCFSAASYAELSRRFPHSAGESVYIVESLGSRHLGALVGYALVLGAIISAATITRGFTGYMSVFSNLPNWSMMTLLIIALTAIALWGVKQSVTIAILTTVLEIGGLLLIIIISGDDIKQQGIDWSSLAPTFSIVELTAITSGAFLAFFAFIGFEDMVHMAEEVKNPQVNLPLGIAIAVTVTTLLYAAIAIIALQTLPIEDLASSSAPMVLLIERNSALPLQLMGAIGVIAMVNGVLLQIIMVSRVLYGMAKQQLAPILLSSVCTATSTPIPATLLAGSLVLTFALWLPVTTLAKATSSLILVVFTLVNLSLLSLRYRERQRGPLQLGTPAAGALLCISFLVMQIWS